mgnify:CR=1 FL=1
MKSLIMYYTWSGKTKAMAGGALLKRKFSDGFKKQTDLMEENSNEKIICRNDGGHVDA